MKDNRDIWVATEFSRHPGGRFKKDGPANGELFRKKFLVDPLRRGDTVVVHMDGARGYGSSFLEEAFGGLVRREGLSREVVLDLLRIDATNSSLRMEIKEYIEKARPENVEATGQGTVNNSLTYVRA